MTKQSAVFTNLTRGLAGAAALAAGTEAYGTVVSATAPTNYVPSSGVTNPPNQRPWDVNNDGIVDFSFYFAQTSTNGNWVSGIYGYGGAGVNCASGYAGPYVTYVYRLGAGATVGPASPFYQATGYVAVFASKFSGVLYGQWSAPNTTGYCGFEFTAADGIHFGYFRLTTNRFQNAANPGGQVFAQAFYETTPNTPITIVPEPSSLAALAFGSALLGGGVALRRRKGAAKA